MPLSRLGHYVESKRSSSLSPTPSSHQLLAVRALVDDVVKEIDELKQRIGNEINTIRNEFGNKINQMLEDLREVWNDRVALEDDQNSKTRGAMVDFMVHTDERMQKLEEECKQMIRDLFARFTANLEHVIEADGKNQSLLELMSAHMTQLENKANEMINIHKVDVESRFNRAIAEMRSLKDANKQS
jgi:hypothetical protein